MFLCSRESLMWLFISILPVIYRNRSPAYLQDVLYDHCSRILSEFQIENWVGKIHEFLILLELFIICFLNILISFDLNHFKQ